MPQKRVLITGSSSGIGKAAAYRFAKAGYYVFLNCDRSLESLTKVQSDLRSEGYACEMVPADVGNPKEVEQMFQTIQDHQGGLDVLINNAGISFVGLLTDMTDEDWNRVIATDLSGVFYCCRNAIPYMVSRKKGKILNVSSMWGTSGSSCEAAYSAAKSGVHGLTKALAKELAPSDIQVNAIACGVIDTAMNDYLSDEEKETLQEAIPADRFGTAEEVAELIFDLAENHPYLTGQIIGLDGGYL